MTPWMKKHDPEVELLARNLSAAKAEIKRSRVEVAWARKINATTVTVETQFRAMAGVLKSLGVKAPAEKIVYRLHSAGFRISRKEAV